MCGEEGNWACCKCYACFPAASTVSLDNGKLVSMSDLKIGDKVKIGINKLILKNYVFENP